MTFGLRCSPPAGRPHPAALPIGVPAVESLLRASFSFASRLRLAFRYSCRHLLRRAPFISIDSTHAGHTGPGFSLRRALARPFDRIKVLVARSIGRFDKRGLKPAACWSLPHSQNASRICSSSLRLFAASEKPVPPRFPAGWLAWPNRGEVMLPMIGPGLVWLSRLRMDIEMFRLKRRLTTIEETPGTPAPNAPPLPSRRPAPLPGPVQTASFPSVDGRNAKALLNRRFTRTEPGPRLKAESVCHRIV
jgi:hypothetical protein